MGISSFNIRVYGLLIHNGAVLITHENRAGMLMYKFPGGGLEKGEGLADALVREFQEELDIMVDVLEHFYVNEFLQVSQFRSSDQLMSHYYFVETQAPQQIPVQQIDESINPGEQSFEWVPLERLNSENFTFPIDKLVAQKLSQTL